MPGTLPDLAVSGRSTRLAEAGVRPLARHLGQHRRRRGVGRVTQPGIQPTNHWLMPRPTCGAADVSSRAAAAALVDATSCS